LASSANNDPAADYPAVLALDGVVETDSATHAADDFFQGMFGDILPMARSSPGWASGAVQASSYAKFRNWRRVMRLSGVR
jgi:hypothetical protein